MMLEIAATENIMEPNETQVPEQRKALVSRWTAAVSQAKSHWSKQFKQMRDDEEFARGKQWPGDPEHRKYVANITLRHIQQRVSDLYAKNPKIVSRKATRMPYQYWDGTAQTLMAAQQLMEAGMAGQLPDPSLARTAQLIIQDAQQGHSRSKMLTRVGRTLELLFENQLKRQSIPFKQQMKAFVRRAVTNGVSYVRMDFQRTTGMLPEIEARLADVRDQLARIERLATEQSEGEFEETDAKAEELRLLIQDLQTRQDDVLYEGLVFDFPRSTNVIPDPKCTNVVGFLGCDWVAQEHPLTTAQIREIYGVDVKDKFNARKGARYRGVIEVEPYRDEYGIRNRDLTDADSDDTSSWATVYEIFSKRDGLVYVICDGYDDFLAEPAAPSVRLERFWPIYTYALNPLDCDDNPFPPSDVSLIRHMQMEVNRSRHGLVEHRAASRPKIIVPSGVLAENDRDLLSNPFADGIPVIELLGLQPNQKVQDILQAYQGPGIDPNLYEVASVMDDIQRTVGVQEANLGGTSKATATESSIAETSRMATSASAIDDLDEVMTAMAEDAGKVLLTEMQEATVKEIVGLGAVWPALTAEQISNEVFLEIEAGSTGRPNQAQEIQNAERIAPFLMQIPGISPEWLAKEFLRRMDDRINLEDAFTPGAPSIQTLNAQLAKQAEMQAGAAMGAGPEAGTQPQNAQQGAAVGGQLGGDPASVVQGGPSGPASQMMPAPSQAQIGQG